MSREEDGIIALYYFNLVVVYGSLESATASTDLPGDETFNLAALKAKAYENDFLHFKNC